VEKNDKPKEYFYPNYVPRMLMMKGLYFHEWFIAVLCLVAPLWIIGYIGILYGLMIASVVWIMCYRRDKRSNLLSELMSLVKFITTSQTIMKGERDIVEENINEETTENEKVKKGRKGKNKKDKKKNKKQSKKKEKNMQAYFPFRSVEDNHIKMEDGRIFVYLKIKGNNLDFMDLKEIDSMNQVLGREFDRSKVLPFFFIQDSVFNIKKNINFVRKKGEENKVEFVRRIAKEIVGELQRKSKTAVKKAAYLGLEVSQDMQKTSSVDDIVNTLKTLFKDTLAPSETSQLELKQLLAIYGSRLFATQLPDTEVEFEDDFEEFLLVKQKKKYKEQQIPGIYNFKDMIVPVSTTFRPSDATIGSNNVKHFGVSSFLMSTEDNNLLAKIATLKGVSTKIFMESLSMGRYRNSMKLDIRSKNSSKQDELDSIDNEIEKDSLKSSYRRLKKEKQNMYYISIIFQLTAKDKKDMEELEAKFKDECDAVGLSVDPLQTKQKDAWMSTSPIGKNKLGQLIKQNISSESVANLYPFSDPSVLDEYGLPIGNIVDRKEIVLFDMFTKRGSNPNILILGYSGVGKTVLLWLLLQNAVVSGYFARNIDVEGICIDFVEKLGGININMAGNNEYCINPLQIRIPDEIRNGLVDDYISEVKNWIRAYKPAWTDRLLDLFEHFLTETYRAKDIYNSTDLKLIPNDKYPLFSDVVDQIRIAKKEFDPEKSLGTIADYDDLILGLQSCTKGADAKMFNRYTNLGEYSNNDIQLINYDISDLLGAEINRKMAQWVNIFTYISQFVNNNLSRSKKIVVAIDELHTFLKKQYMSVVEILEMYERRFRKYEASFIKATQTVEELDKDDDDMKDKVKTLFSQPGVKFMFHLGDIKYQQVKDLLNLKSNEIEKLQEKRQGQCLMRIGSEVYDLNVMMPEWFKLVKKDA
jgi:hypothetical protein